ncbi:MAG: helix-turn-helix domain-containing protein [Gaiellaceae bacterium]
MNIRVLRRWERGRRRPAGDVLAKLEKVLGPLPENEARPGLL